MSQPLQLQYFVCDLPPKMIPLFELELAVLEMPPFLGQSRLSAGYSVTPVKL